MEKEREGLPEQADCVPQGTSPQQGVVRLPDSQIGGTSATVIVTAERLTIFKTRSTPLVPIEVQALCPRKGCKGVLEAMGEGLTVGWGPTWWRHRCTSCGVEYSLAERHPRIDYKLARKKAT